MPMGMAPPPGGPPPQGGVNQMVAQDMAGRMGGGPAGGNPVAEIEQHLQQAVMLTVQAGPEAFVMNGIGEVWKGAFATLKSSGIGPGGSSAPQGAGAPGAPAAMPQAGPQMPMPMGR